MFLRQVYSLAHRFLFVWFTLPTLLYIESLIQMNSILQQQLLQGLPSYCTGAVNSNSQLPNSSGNSRIRIRNVVTDSGLSLSLDDISPMNRMFTRVVLRTIWNRKRTRVYCKIQEKPRANFNERTVHLVLGARVLPLSVDARISGALTVSEGCCCCCWDAGR